MTEFIVGRARLLLGDCREVMPGAGLVDVVVVDPPYGATSLPWDRRVDGWLAPARATLKPRGSMWVFGSMAFFLETASEFAAAGWKYAQDVVWKKHNGSGFQSDRFRRIHEHAVQFYPADVPWETIYKSPQHTMDAVRKSVRRKTQPVHLGKIDSATYETEDGGPRLMRSVIEARSCHGFAEHPTQKPIDVLDPLIRFSCPTGGVVADWFMGSGSTGVAALEAGCGFVGAELYEPHFDVACRRIEKAAGGLLAMIAAE